VAIETEMAFCAKHPFVDSVGKCRTCHGVFCEECLIFPRGKKRSALCIACGLAAAGLTSSQRFHQRELQRFR